ncbi:hypothetical protein SKAU_G00340690, partial [Synaphobranchus kaupii]
NVVSFVSWSCIPLSGYLANSLQLRYSLIVLRYPRFPPDVAPTAGRSAPPFYSCFCSSCGNRQCYGSGCIYCCLPCCLNRANPRSAALPCPVVSVPSVQIRQVQFRFGTIPETRTVQFRFGTIPETRTVQFPFGTFQCSSLVQFQFDPIQFLSSPVPVWNIQCPITKSSSGLEQPSVPVSPVC